jgi:deoxyribodipyrimidine photo-lyase
MAGRGRRRTVEGERIRLLCDEAADPGGRYVLYWMQQSQRAVHNPALEFAVDRADEAGVGVVVAFGLMDDYPEATERHYAFMLEGLAETAGALEARGMKFVLLHGHPRDVAIALTEDAVEVVCDRAYLRHLKRWRTELAQQAGKRVTQVEGDVVVPVDTASEKAEHSARTIRPKLNDRRQHFLHPLASGTPERTSTKLHVKTPKGTSRLDPAQVDKNLRTVSCIREVARSEHFSGGTSEAQTRLTNFIRSQLEGYADGRNEPVADQSSHLSPYLQYGQISPVEVAHKVQKAKSGTDADREAFLEELIVRRELAHNHAEHRPDYDKFACLPNWAHETLAEHADDPRKPRYTRKQLERAETDDAYWNAAQTEMVKTGFMHNYMRMYWGKKILEWSTTPKKAFETVLALNNKYLLDGLNANSYANVGWIFGLHDRAWTERAVFGKVRYMNANGLERKFDIDAYVNRIAAL